MVFTWKPRNSTFICGRVRDMKAMARSIRNRTSIIRPAAPNAMMKTAADVGEQIAATASPAIGAAPSGSCVDRGGPDGEQVGRPVRRRRRSPPRHKRTAFRSAAAAPGWSDRSAWRRPKPAWMSIARPDRQERGEGQLQRQAPARCRSAARPAPSRTGRAGREVASASLAGDGRDDPGGEADRRASPGRSAAIRSRVKGGAKASAGAILQADQQRRGEEGRQRVHPSRPR